MTLVAGFAGEIVQPESPGYEVAATSYGVLGSPALVLRPTTTADVAAAILFACSEDLVISVRSGGHSMFGTNDGGVVIDLSGIRDVEVLDGNLVRVGSGAVWGDVANSLTPHGLAVSSGDTYSVGVGGLTLGGGVGWMVRQHGLAIDSLVEAEVVLASGDVVTTNTETEPDLFWALRGGGGNFGVVTRFTFQAHPLAGVVFGSIVFDPSALEQTLRGWRDAMRVAPEELNSTFLAMPAMGPNLPASTSILVLYAGTDERAADAAIAPLLALPGVISSELSAKAYADVLDEPHGPEGEVTMVDNNTFADDFNDELIGKLATAQAGMGAAVLMIRYLRGAFNRVEPDATAVAWRNAEVLIISAAFLPPNASEAEQQRIHELWATLAAHTGGKYGNFTVRTGAETIGLMYPPATARRLKSIKGVYDPDNVFARNQNIVP